MEVILMVRHSTLLAAAALFGLLATGTAAHAQGRDQIGTLDCAIAPGIGFVVGSSKQVDCIFTPSSPGWRRERYFGVIDKFGVDIGVTAAGRLLWAVHANTVARRHALAGRYAGATAEATVGGGLGANALYGGSDRTVSLQPISLQGQAGLNVAAGVAELTLEPAVVRRRR
jgi:hypothetical protein